MSKPLPTQNTWAALSPPWNLTQLDANFTNVWAAFADVGTYSNVYTDTGAVNAMVVTLPAGLTVALAAGLTVGVKVANTNTSATVTLNLNGTGAVGAKDINGATLLIGQLQAGVAYTFIYNGGLWCCQNINNFTGGSGAPLVLRASKAASTARSSTTSGTNDPDLLIAIPFSGRWSFEVGAMFSTGAGGLGYGVVFTGTTGTSPLASPFCNAAGGIGVITTGQPLFVIQNAAPTIAATITNAQLGGANSVLVLIKGYIAATSVGNLSLTWAQQVSSVAATTALLGSYMTATLVS
jgi:hypothetical protein